MVSSGHKVVSGGEPGVCLIAVQATLRRNVLHVSRVKQRYRGNRSVLDVRRGIHCHGWCGLTSVMCKSIHKGVAMLTKLTYPQVQRLLRSVLTQVRSMYLGVLYSLNKSPINRISTMPISLNLAHRSDNSWKTCPWGSPGRPGIWILKIR